MLATGLSNPNHDQIAIQHHVLGQQQNQAQPQILNESLNIQVNQQGQENGENVAVNQRFCITVRRDL